jgi:EmrB/QacA subfamily drug resistance transporter
MKQSGDFRNSASYKWWVLVTVSTAMLMVGLDLGVLSSCLPQLAAVFHTDTSVIGWLNITYFVVSLSLALTLAKVGDALGRKKVFLTGLVLYSLGLVVGSVAQTVGQLFTARAIQGAGGAMTVALSTAITIAAFPGEERGRAVGILSGVASIGLVAGPMVGGFMLDLLGWRSIFYTRIPVVLASFVLAIVIIKEQGKQEAKAFKLDVWGSVSLFSWLSSFLLFLSLGNKLGFASISGLGLIGLAVVCFVLFIIAEQRAVEPIVHLGLFRKKLFSAAIASSMLTTVGTSTTAFLLPFYLMGGLGFSGSMAGAYMALLALPAVAFSPLSGWASDKMGSRVLSTAGVVIGCIGVLWLSRLGASPTAVALCIGIGLVGTGMGIFHPPNSSSLIGSVSRDMLGVASAIAMMARNVGTSVALAFSGALFSLYESHHVLRLGEMGLNVAVLRKTASVNSFHDTLIVALPVAVLGIFTSLVRGSKGRAE